MLKTVKNTIRFPTLVLFLAFLVDGIAFRMITPILSIYVIDLGFSIVDLGIISAAFGLGLLISEPFWGMLTNRIGGKKVFSLCLLMTSLSIFSFTLLRDLLSFIALRFLAGVSMGALGPSSRTLVRTAISKGGRAFGAWYMIFAAADLIGPAIGGYVATASYSLAFYTAAAAAFIALFLSFGAPDSKSVDSVNNGNNRGSMDKTVKKTLFITSSLTILPMFLSFVFTTFMPVFAKEKLLLNPLEIGLAFTFMGVVGLFAPLVFGELSDRIGRKRIIIFGMLLGAFSFLLLSIVSGIIMLYLTAVISGLGNAAVNPSMMALLTDKVQNSNMGFALGVYGAGEDIGMWIGPLIVGYVYQIYSAELSFYLTAGLILFNIVAAIPLLKKI